MPAYAVQMKSPLRHDWLNFKQTNDLDEAKKVQQYYQCRNPEYDWRIAPGKPTRRKQHGDDT